MSSEKEIKNENMSSSESACHDDTDEDIPSRNKKSGTNDNDTIDR